MGKKRKKGPSKTKEKKVKRKRPVIKLYQFYKADYKKNAVERTKKFCPRCESNFLAQHSNRISCGQCGYTEYLKAAA